MNRIMTGFCLAGTLFCSYSVYAADIPSDVIGAQKYDKQNCVQEYSQNCISNACLNSDRIDCQDNCRKMAQEKCRQQSNE